VVALRALPVLSPHGGNPRAGVHRALRQAEVARSGGGNDFLPPLSGQVLQVQREKLRSVGGIGQMTPSSGQWRCRICGFDRWHTVSVRRKNGAIYNTAFYACSSCSVMFLNPAQFNTNSDAPANVELSNVLRLPARR
jgi:hypothetical protein